MPSIKYLFCLFAFASLTPRVGIAQVKQHAAPPQKIWVSLGHSTVDERPADFEWLEKQCVSGQVLQTLAPIQTKLQGVIVPVFDDGKCFYNSQIAPFKGRNPRAAQHEKGLMSLLKAAERTKTPIYLGVDVLAWERALASNQGIFANRKTWSEINVEAAASDVPMRVAKGGNPTAFYASPFHSEVRQSLSGLMGELAKKFPSATGVVLDIRLDSRDILGYSEAARHASILSLSLDPLDLNLSNRAELVISQPLRRWMNWRNKQMTSLVSSLSNSYRNQNKSGKIILNGMANYYAERDFNDLRRNQDWQAWMKTLPIYAVLSDGRWLPRFDEISAFEKSLSAPSRTQIVPQSLGSYLIADSSYALDWASLKNRNPNLNNFSAYVRNDADLKQLLLLATQGASLRPVAPQVGFPALDWNGTLPSGRKWDSSAIRGKKELVALVMNVNSLKGYEEFGIEFSRLARQPQFAKTEFYIMVNNAVTPPAFPRDYLISASREAFLPAKTPATIIITDQAGFLRYIEPITSAGQMNGVLKEQLFTPQLEVGKQAPAFSMPDMNGRLITPTMLLGRKNLLITFFPKCFTGGCAQQLASLKQHYADFKEADTEIIGVSVDPADTQIIFARSLALPFNLLPDTGRHLSLLYGAVSDKNELAGRQSILIDKNGIVRLIDREVDTHNHGPDLLQKMVAMGLAKSSNHQGHNHSH